MAPRNKPGVQAKGGSLTVRLDPKLRYALELMARKQRRTLSSVIEWAIEKAANDPEGGIIEKDEKGRSLNLLEQIWDVEEFDRLYNMRIHRPSLMSFEEEKIAKQVFESDFIFAAHDKYESLLGNDDRKYHSKIKEAVRPYYSTFVKVAEGKLDSGKLPTFPKK